MQGGWFLNTVQAELQHMRMENTRLRLRLTEAGLGLTQGAQLTAVLWNEHSGVLRAPFPG